MPRRMKTEPPALPDGDELPELTPNQLAFVKGILDGKTASDAYREAYSADEWQPTTVWARASELRANRKVQAWLSAARKAELGSAVRTREQHVRRLERLSVVAEETGNIGAAVQAEHYIGKVEGHYVEQYRDVTERDPIDTLKELAKLSPELAKALAAQYGVKFLGPAPVIEHLPQMVEAEQ